MADRNDQTEEAREPHEHDAVSHSNAQALLWRR